MRPSFPLFWYVPLRWLPHTLYVELRLTVGRSFFEALKSALSHMNTSLIFICRVGYLTFWIWIGYKKNLWIFFQKYGFIRKIEPFHLRMNHNIIQITAPDGITVPHSFNPIFQYVFNWLGFNSMNATSISCFKASIVSGWLAWYLSLTAPHKKYFNRVKSQFWGSQLTSKFRLIIQFFKTVLERSIVTLAVWPRPVETKCRPCHPLQFLETKIRWACPGIARHWP